MKISYNWLKQFIQTDWTAEKMGDLLTDLGLEVEAIEEFESIKGALKGIVVGEVKTCVQHPNADRLKLTTVDIGEKESLQIVCGAPNVAEGQKVPVATIGTDLYDKEGKIWRIKKGKIRGEESHGMICSEDEIGMGDSHEGIMVLDNTYKVGTPLSDIFEVENDHVFEIGLTPNRADAMSHYGVARDVKAGLLQHEINRSIITPSVSSFHVENRALKIPVDVMDKEKAPRYCGITISGLEVKPSPLWMQNRLKAIGVTPKNNIVDITNYVLHEIGQPLHAFDANKITGQKVVVKTLAAGTKFVTLDGVERTLHQDDLMICDNVKPMCIAGVYGGQNSGVSEHTTAIFLESAYFDPISIRQTAKRHGLNTDASFRFERGIDPNITEYALKRATLLILELAGGEITSDLVDVYKDKIEDNQVRLSFANAAKLIGEEIPRETIKQILMSLDIKINNVTETGLGLTVPAYRNDVEREADIIEEILRVYGYNKIKTKEKLNASITHSSQLENYKIQNIISEQLVGQGFYEIMGNSLTTPDYIKLSEHTQDLEKVEMLNPLSGDLSVMRQSLLYTGLETIIFNINRRQEKLQLFEFGTTYSQNREGFNEKKHLALFVSGTRSKDRWNAIKGQNDFFFLKGVVGTIFDRLGINGLSTSPFETDIFSEGILQSKNDIPLVEMGLVSSKILKYFGIAQEVLYADFKWDAIIDFIQANTVKFKNIPKYPSVRRDFALLLDEHISFNSIDEIANNTEKQILKDVDLFDVYQGKNLPSGKKSYAVSFIFQDDKKTMTDKQIDKVMEKLKSNFEKELGAKLR